MRLTAAMITKTRDQNNKTELAKKDRIRGLMVKPGEGEEEGLTELILKNTFFGFSYTKKY